MIAKNKSYYWDRYELSVFAGAVAILALLAAAVSGNSYFIQVVGSALLTGALALALNIVVGWAHLHSFAQAALYGVGGYTSAILATKLGASFFVSFVAAVLISAIVGLLVALPSIRISGTYFAIATIGLQMIIIAIINKGGEFTGGPAGIVGVPPIEIFGVNLSSGMAFFAVASVWLIFVLIICLNLRKSRYGAELGIIGAAPEVAESIGIHSSRLKALAFVLCAAIAGGTGSLYVHSLSVADPRSFSLPISATLLVMVLLGGRGSIPAVLFTAITLSVLPEYLRFIAEYRLIVFGALMVLIVLFLPNGIASLTQKFAQRKLRRGGQSSSEETSAVATNKVKAQ